MCVCVYVCSVCNIVACDSLSLYVLCMCVVCVCVCMCVVCVCVCVCSPIIKLCPLKHVVYKPVQFTKYLRKFELITPPLYQSEHDAI